MLRAAVCSTLLLVVSLAQVPQFEVAAIHPTDPKEFATPSGCTTTPGLMRCSNVTLKRCIVGAYGIGPDRILGGPDWINTDRFQITGISDQPAGDKPLMTMLQALLAQRFKLACHWESRRSHGMVLEVAKHGPKLQPSSAEEGGYNNAHNHIEAKSITMGRFAEILSRNLNLPVIDRTGLTGAFKIMLRWNPDVADGLNHDESTVALWPEVSKAISRQLGLSLKPRKMPVDFLVIDHAEKPSESDN